MIKEDVYTFLLTNGKKIFKIWYFKRSPRKIAP